MAKRKTKPTVEEEKAIQWARDNKANDNLEIDGEPATSNALSGDDLGGIWVAAWIWVPEKEV